MSVSIPRKRTGRAVSRGKSADGFDLGGFAADAHLGGGFIDSLNRLHARAQTRGEDA